jgi:adenosylhomocysteine nucleosidase
MSWVLRGAAAPLAILSALAQEQHGLIERLAQARCVSHAGREFWLGTLHGQNVVLALSRIGKVAAATTTTALIERFGASGVLFTGVAGGLGADVQVGDVVVATEFVQHDLDVSPLFPRYEVPLYGRARFACHAQLSEVLVRAARQGLDALQQPGQRAAVVHCGLIASGDRFVSTAAESRALQQALPQALAVEMEGAAVAQVCFDYQVPLAAVRTISDRADDQAHGDFNQFIEQVASRYAHAIVDGFVVNLP